MSDAVFTHDVFLSHSSKDKAVVRAVAKRLRADGLRVWHDEWELKPGIDPSASGAGWHANLLWFDRSPCGTRRWPDERGSGSAPPRAEPYSL
ncbi:MAG: toll/interleukin-1 receptor domain-containing protein [Gammaproteobacteria bacterium]